jgi:hypothetical protein
MGQKVNSNLFRLGQSTNKFYFIRYLPKNTEEKALFLNLIVNLNNYIKQILKLNKLLLHSLQIHFSTKNTVNIFISFYTYLTITTLLKKYKLKLHKDYIKYKKLKAIKYIILKNNKLLKKKKKKIKILKFKSRSLIKLYKKKYILNNNNKTLFQKKKILTKSRKNILFLIKKIFINYKKKKKKIKTLKLKLKKLKSLRNNYNSILQNKNNITNLQNYNSILLFKKQNNFNLKKKKELKMFKNKILESLNLFFSKNLNTFIIFQNLNSEITNIFTNSELEKLKKKVFKLKRFKKHVFYSDGLNILAITLNKTNSANFLANFLTFYLSLMKKKHLFLNFVSEFLFLNYKASFSKIKGLKIMVKGRLGKSSRTKVRKIIVGQIPIQTLKSKINYSDLTSYTSAGTIGVKVWICEN